MVSQETLPNDFNLATQTELEEEDEELLETLQLPGVMEFPSTKPAWVTSVVDDAATKAAEATITRISQKYDDKFAALDRNHTEVIGKVVELSNNQSGMQATLLAQQGQIDELKKQFQGNKRGYAFSEVGSAQSTAQSTRADGNMEYEDKELVVAGGWSPNTAKAVMEKDIQSILATMKEKTGAIHTTDEVKVTEGFGEFCRFKIDSPGKTRKTNAWEVTDWFLNEKKHNPGLKYMGSPNVQGKAGGELWMVIHKTKQKRDEGGDINTGLSALHKVREDLGYQDNFTDIRGARIQIVKGKFLGETKGVRWLGEVVGTLDGDKIAWKLEELAASIVPIPREKLEPIYQQKVQEKKAKRERR